MTRDDRSRSDDAHARDEHDALAGPSPFLEENIALLAPGRTLDVAAGAAAVDVAVLARALLR